MAADRGQRDALVKPGGNDIPDTDWPQIVREIRAHTPARLLAGRAGAAYRTPTQLDLRAAHAAARDAVRLELDLSRHFDPAFLSEFALFEVCTQAAAKDEYLLRPDLGRKFGADSRQRILQRCTKAPEVQVALADGLSVTALSSQGPGLFRLLQQGANARGWTVGQGFVIRHCRVGILNEIGELLDPKVAVLLIGERPGLATAESLSAYLAYRPTKDHTDAQRNLISNIHPRGVNPQQAVTRILNVVERMMRMRTSGCRLSEEADPPRELD
jgi:ethanolamine ammonia-lyase small subunit